ncbi:MAG TPA: hypothetical protein VGS96_08710 [Thermoanaerobaculia bacterium]|nr:hypothetical protein [Thermoanaerobaculia bacterium]
MAKKKTEPKTPMAAERQLEIRKIVAVERIADALDKLLGRIEGIEEAAQILAHGRKE